MQHVYIFAKKNKTQEAIEDLEDDKINFDRSSGGDEATFIIDIYNNNYHGAVGSGIVAKSDDLSLHSNIIIAACKI